MSSGGPDYYLHRACELVSEALSNRGSKLGDHKINQAISLLVLTRALDEISKDIQQSKRAGSRNTGSNSQNAGG
jgi:hypothetical protein